MWGNRAAIFSLNVAIVLMASYGSAQEEEGASIDQLIWQSSENPNSFDEFFDLDGDWVLFGMDMVIPYEEFQMIMEANDTESAEPARHKRKATKRSQSRWTNNIIPYNMDYRAGFSGKDQDVIKKAINEWSFHTCLSFRQRRSSDRNYVNFDNGNGCYSYVGMTGGAQKIGLARGCRHKGIVVHEIGHAVGFHHEQNRPDRDNHVRILFQNIPQSVAYNFKKYPWSAVETLDVPYDYTSVMHYGGKAFSNNGQYTIKTLNPAFQNKIGNRHGLSFQDIKLANLMYKCADKCGSKSCPAGAFLNKHCKCMCPGSPVKECSGTETGRTTRPPTTKPIKTTTPRPNNCKDNSQYCESWSKSAENYCRTNAHVKEYCKKSCGLCAGPVTLCLDNKKHCNYWKGRGYCEHTHVDYMKTNCAKTCGHCKTSRVGAGEDDGNFASGLAASLAVVVATVVLGSVRV